MLIVAPPHGLGGSRGVHKLGRGLFVLGFCAPAVTARRDSISDLRHELSTLRREALRGAR
jgi:hypothetical protein